MLGLGWPELILILAIVLLIFGGSRLKDLAKGVGESVREFKKASSEPIADEKDKDAIFETARKMGIKTEGKDLKQVLNEISQMSGTKS